MSDKLSQFISGLQTLDPRNLGAPANQAALQKFQGLDSGSQRDVLNGLAGKFGTSFDELASYPADVQNKIAANIQAGRDTFEGVQRAQAPQPAQQQPQPAPQQPQPAPQQPQPAPQQPQPAQAQPQRPASFEDRWTAAANAARTESRVQPVADDSEFRARHGDEAARVRHGYQSPERQAQLARIADMQSEAKATGKSFSEIADARVAAGQ